MSDLEILSRLGLALALGLLIGLERGWHVREWEEGQRVAGVRTYALIGLLGGVWALISGKSNLLLLGLGLLCLSLVVITAYYLRVREKHDIGITSVVAALLTFSLGAMVMFGYSMAAAATAVVTTLILDLKPQLHLWLRKLQPRELNASLELLLISVVILPILPDKGYGPWQALNPYVIWWMVVLITSISFIGYFAMRISSARFGALLTGISGGLASSTAVSVSLSKLAQENPAHNDALACGIIASCATMFPRMLLVASVINPALFTPLLAPLGFMALVSYLGAFWFWRKTRGNTSSAKTQVSNPFQIGMAIKFSALLALVMLLASAMQAWLGDLGLYLLAALSAITDVDAITLSVSRMSTDQLPLPITAMAIFIAAATNTMVKGGISLVIGSASLGWRVCSALLLGILSGLLAIMLI